MPVGLWLMEFLFLLRRGEIFWKLQVLLREGQGSLFYLIVPISALIYRWVQGESLML